MIDLDIPGFQHLHLKHLVADFNGTLAIDGELLPGVADLLRALSQVLEIHVLTADTFGTAQEALRELPVILTVLPEEDQAKAKRYHVLRLGAEHVAALGNGRNDERMVSTAALGVAVVQAEGASPGTVSSAKIVSSNIVHALELFLKPNRLLATLRA